jgi:hypothetical protein
LRTSSTNARWRYRTAPELLSISREADSSPSEATLSACWMSTSWSIRRLNGR